MENFIIIVVVALIVGLAARYIYKEKKRGVKCIGCPAGCSCSSKGNGEACGCGCGCAGSTETK